MEAQGTPEEKWFAGWTSTVESLLEPYKGIATLVGLRSAEVEERVQHVLCTRILRQAVYRHSTAWADAHVLLAGGGDLTETLAQLFGDETPAPVAAMVLRTVIQQSDVSDEGEDSLIGGEVRNRVSDLLALGPPQHVWVVRMGRFSMEVSVEDRSQLRDKTVGLVRVVDMR